MYIVTISDFVPDHPAGCSFTDYEVMTTIDPQGNIAYDCLPQGGKTIYNGNNIVLINQKFNSILSQGYKLVSTDSNNKITGGDEIIGAWYFAIP